MKKRLLIFSISVLSFVLVMGQGSLRTSFNLGATNPSVAGTRITPWPGAVYAEYKAVAVEPTSGDIIAVGFVNLGTLPAPANDIIVSRYTKSGGLNTAFDTDGHIVINVGGSLDEAFGVVVSGGKI